MSKVIWPYPKTEPRRYLKGNGDKNWKELGEELNYWLQSRKSRFREDSKKFKKHVGRRKANDSSYPTEKEVLYFKNKQMWKRYYRGTRIVLLLYQKIENALDVDREGSKYAILEPRHIQAMGEAMIRSCAQENSSCEYFASNNFVFFLEKEEDILDLALEYFFPGNVFSKNPAFSRRPPSHAVISGHGFHVTGQRLFRVPAGKYIYFYTGEDTTLNSNVGNNIEGIVNGHVMAVPLEIREPGELIKDYYLGYPGGGGDSLTIKLRGHVNGVKDVVVNRDPWRWYPLSALQHTRLLKGATHWHWCCCRERLTLQTLKRDLNAEAGRPGTARSPNPILVVPSVKRGKVGNLGHINVSAAGTKTWRGFELDPELPLMPRLRR